MVLTPKTTEGEREKKAKKELGSSLHPVEMAVCTGHFETLAYSTCEGILKRKNFPKYEFKENLSIEVVKNPLH